VLCSCPREPVEAGGSASGGPGPCRAALRRSGAPGDHAVPWGGHSWIFADPLHDAGQAVQTGNQRRLSAAGIWEERNSF